MNQGNTSADTNAEAYGTQKKRMFVIDESDTPIMVNIDDLMKARHCGPKRAAYIYERLPLITLSWEFTVIDNDDGCVMRSYTANIMMEIIKANNRYPGDFDIREVVQKHCYMKEEYNLTHMLTIEHCYEWWYDILNEERDEMVGVV